jgi:hypothetical protein
MDSGTTRSERRPGNERGRIIGSFGWVAAFAAGMVLGFFVVRIVVWFLFATEQPPSEAYEGFGDAMMAGYAFLFGMALWLPFAAVFAGKFRDWLVRQVAG